MTLFANGLLAAALRRPATESSVAVTLDCPGSNRLEATVYDRAGNETTTETVLVCEDRGPVFTILPASWRQEGNVDAVYRADGRAIDYVTAQPVFASFEEASSAEVRIERYWARLHESVVGRSDLPRVRFEVWDRSGSGVVVEYRHETAAGPGAWVPAATSADATFEVPIGYEELGASLLEQHQSAQAIVLRATDAFGVTNERLVSFRLALRSPPVWVGSCSLMASAMDPASVVQRLRTGSSSDVGSFETRWLTGVPNGSPIQPLGVELRASSPGATVEFTQVGTVRFDGSFTSRSNAGGPSYLSCGWAPAGVGSPYENYRCSGVRTDGTWTWLQNPSLGTSRTVALPPAESFQALSSPLNQPSANPSGLSLYLGQQPITPVSGTAFQVPADQDIEGYVSMNPAPIRIQGQVYNWPTQPSLVIGGLAPAASYGTAYWLPTVGSEFGAHGRNLTCTPSQRIAVSPGGPSTLPSCTWQERPIQTLPRLTRVVVRSPVPVISASVPALGLSAPVQRAADCTSEWRYELDLTLL